MSLLGTAFASELKRAMEAKRLGVTEASKALRVSRQAFYNYLNGVSTPRAGVLARAMELWEIRITVGGTSFDHQQVVQRRKPIVVAKQLTLWDKLDSIKDDDLTIKVKRVGKTLRVSVDIDIPA
jgi:transcriptional regulator with XRE-family HTH domain